MNATILPEKKRHYPVLLNEIISIITPQYGGTFIDCTFGQGGYTKKILEYSKSKVIALDRDEKSKIISSNIKKKFKNRFFFKNKKFSQIKEIARILAPKIPLMVKSWKKIKKKKN